MLVRIGELKCREVINIQDGCRMGFIGDVELDSAGGNVTALIIPGRPKLFGLLGREEDTVIPWGCIRRLGGDTILVEADLRRKSRPRRKGPWGA